MKTKTVKKRKVKEAYFDWLYAQVQQRELSGLEEFIFDLHSFPFVCRVPNDDNRADDGIQLREVFADEQDFDLVEDPLIGPCSVLEMLVALANRMDFVLFDESKGNRMPKWFWLFIDNLRLKRYTHNDLDVVRKKKFNRVVIKKFVNREYQPDGKGGIFPLNNPASDQRNVELWYQLMEYISENYNH